jgi:hypothetical protein
MIIKVKKRSNGVVISSISEKTLLFKEGELLSYHEIYLASRMKDVEVRYSNNVSSKIKRRK